MKWWGIDFADISRCRCMPGKGFNNKSRQRKDIAVVMFMDTSHAWKNEDNEMITVDKARMVFDIALINMTGKMI